MKKLTLSIVLIGTISSCGLSLTTTRIKENITVMDQVVCVQQVM